jgi:membrane-bound metal-dependent hydrolase YbcI (DUF457 family)
MDTITHGIAGALIGKAAFGGSDLFPPIPVDKRRIVTWSLMLGAIFPDSDVLRDIFSHDQLLLLTWHRSVTHSLLCLPIWAVLLAALTQAVARWRKWDSPSLTALVGIYSVGILSHILLDLATTFGTMIWSPLDWSRPAWDILFIIDFTFTAILLIPQMLAWTFEDREHMRGRAILLWLLFALAPFVVARIGQTVGAPVSNTAIAMAVMVITVLFLLPAVKGWGLGVPYLNWNRAGLTLALAYFFAAVYAHHVALQRVEQFAKDENLQVEARGALPLPPSFWRWDGLVRAPRGVYEFRMDLSDRLFRNAQGATASSNFEALEHTYYPDAFPNPFIEQARRLPEVQKVLWFARFPVTRFHKEGPDAVVEISDLRFPTIRKDRPAGFTYQVKFAPDGTVLSQGWVRR